MDWSSVELSFRYMITWEKKYWKLMISWVFLGSFIRIIQSLITGIFVDISSLLDNYTTIIVVGIALTRAFWQAFGSLVRFSARLDRNTRIWIYKGLFYIIFSRFLWDLKVIIYFFLGYAFLPTIFGVLSILDIVKIFLFSIIIMLFSYAFAFLFSPLFIKARSEAYNLIELIEDLLSIIVPTSFLLSYFFFYKYLFFLPPIVLIEEFRKIFLGIPTDFNMVSLSLIFSFIYFLFGYFLFVKYFNLARKRGWVKLK